MKFGSLCAHFVPFAGPFADLAQCAAHLDSFACAKGAFKFAGDVFTLGGASPIVESALNFMGEVPEAVGAIDEATSLYRIATESISLAVGAFGLQNDLLGSKRGFFAMFAKENPKLSDVLEKCLKVSQGTLALVDIIDELEKGPNVITRKAFSA